MLWHGKWESGLWRPRANCEVLSVASTVKLKQTWIACLFSFHLFPDPSRRRNWTSWNHLLINGSISWNLGRAFALSGLNSKCCRYLVLLIMSDVFGKRRDEVLYVTTILLTNRKDWKKKSYELIHLHDQITCGQNSNEFQSSIYHVDF